MFGILIITTIPPGIRDLKASSKAEVIDAHCPIIFIAGHRHHIFRIQQHQSSSNKELKKLPNLSLSAAALLETPAMLSTCPNILTCVSGTITDGGPERLLLLLLLLLIVL